MYPTQEPSSDYVPAPVDQTTDQKQRRLVVKHQNQFLLLDLCGGMPAKNGAGLGLYVNDTRFLSQWHMTVADQPLHFLTADADEGYTATLTYGNKAFSGVPDGAIAVNRLIVVDEKELVSETITLQNFHSETVSFEAKLAFGADYADMFEVRGATRAVRGFLLPSKLAHTGRAVTLRYLGQDNILRQTRLSFAGRKPARLSGSEATFAIVLKPQEKFVIEARIQTAESVAAKEGSVVRAGQSNPRQSGRPVQNHGRRFDFARLSTANPLKKARHAYQSWGRRNAHISTARADFNRLLERSHRDIYLLRQQTGQGNAVAAGVPWFAVPFGRDSLIAGLQTLPFMPELSRDIVQFLAAYQGKKYDAETCEKPGRIMHELRPGEMAGLAEIPFRPYFGTVDATPLWLMLYARYVEWTGDLDFARSHWSTARKALQYLTRETRDTYVYYGGTGALTNQGWKDSGNCIVYSNGKLAKGPIAVCEAQGYLYAAWQEVAAVALKLGHKSTSKALIKKAGKLKERFNLDFWMPLHNTVCLALDGEGRQCDSVASNAGHLLGTGILPANREKQVADRLMQDDMFSGWGIRTLASSEKAFHPTDYQVGAVWPHDNGMIAQGMYQIGESEKAHRVTQAMLETAMSQSDLRLPELFAGFSRGQEKQPVPYQVACIPQLWAAGCAFHMVAGMLGLRFDAAANTLHICKPAIPAWLGRVEVNGLKVGDGEVNLTFHHTTSGATTVEIQRVAGNVRCLVEH
jgi:glycogen debranching enzyme